MTRKQLLENTIRKMIKTELTKKNRLNEDSTHSISGFKKQVDKLSNSPEEFFRELSEFIDKTGFLQLNSTMPSLYKDPYLRKKLNFAEWLAYKNNLNLSDVKKYMIIIELLNRIDDTLFGNKSKEGIFISLMTIYTKDGNFSKSSYDGTFR